MTNKNSSISGYFGKLPVRGDFIQRNLNGEFVTLWDEWLQKVMNASHTTLGEQWLDHYLIAPIWRYFLTLENGDQYAGIMLPSVDKVGRYFPFTMATMLTKTSSFADFISSNKNWFEQAEIIAIQALDEQLSYEQLNLAVDNLSIPEDNGQSPAFDANIKAYRVVLSEQTPVDLAVSLIQAKMNNPAAKMTSYWWNQDEEQSSGNVICCLGFPDETLFIAMLDGQWDLCQINNLEVPIK